MLSNNKYPALLIFLISISAVLFFGSCGKEEKVPVIDYQNKKQILDISKRFLDSNTKVAFGGNFDQSGEQQIAVGTEFENNQEWGIKFMLFEKNGNDFDKKFESEVLDGSFRESFAEKIKFPSFPYELIFYNSQSYYLGSGGGEIYAYIVDFGNSQVYYAHLVIERGLSPSLFISENTDVKELRSFITMFFKKDYPELRLVDDDIVLD